MNNDKKSGIITFILVQESEYTCMARNICLKITQIFSKAWVFEKD